ncbi:MAG TPA: DUF2213 domain-containing protein [Acidimicrobiales bacterium]|nr:DUF2213 domain-containing protein [Acidimicrobiales bacterium]
MPFFATEQISPRQSLTPEGYLLCECVPIARTGSQVYVASELPDLAPGPDGLITVFREEAEVFRPETVASFEGKSVTVHHTFVTPENVRQVEVGHAQNVRRSDTEPDLLVADLLIKDAHAIDLVRTKYDAEGREVGEPMREISCGYDAEYFQERPGVAVQRQIIGNHIAIVPKGRAGPRVAIQDQQGELPMSTATKTQDAGLLAKLLGRLFKAAKTGDAAEIEAVTKDAAEAGVEVEVEDEKPTFDAQAAFADLRGTVDTLAKTVADLAAKVGDKEPDPVKTGDDGEKAQAVAALPDVASRAEILVPGFAVPTADAVATLADVAEVQRKALAEFVKTEDGAKLAAPLLAGRTVDALSADAVGTVFVAASELARSKNNAGTATPAAPVRSSDAMRNSIAEINARNAAFWAKQN